MTFIDQHGGEVHGGAKTKKTYSSKDEYSISILYNMENDEKLQMLRLPAKTQPFATRHSENAPFSLYRRYSSPAS